MPTCKYCHTRLDPVWAEAGYDSHVTCEEGMGCPHGELRGPKACAICRRNAGPVKEANPPVNRNVASVGSKHPVTSIIAAERTMPTTGTKRRMIMDAVLENGGLCDWELERKFDWKHESASAARRSLVVDGWLEDSGRRRPVPDTGNAAIVWAVVGQLF
jgi:hypothetical protein